MSGHLHSLRFDDLAVVLPSQIDHPLLRQLALRLQSDVLTSMQLKSADLAKVQWHVKADTIRSFNGVRAKISGRFSGAGSPLSVGGNERSITQAAMILDQLTSTAIADAAVLVAITHEPRPRLLLTRRAGHLHAHAGEVSLAGGKFETTDGSNVVTALREACEETALPPNQVQVIGQLPVQSSKSGLQVRPIVALVPPSLVLVPELGEIARIFWADFTTLVDQPLEEYRIDYQLQDQTLTLLTPSWVIDGERVWGLTGRIIASLLELGFDRKIDWYYRAQA